MKKPINGSSSVEPDSELKSQGEEDCRLRLESAGAANPDQALRRELHTQHKTRIWEDIQSSTDSFDQSLLTLSSGALGVSLAFIKDIVPLKEAVWVSVLFTSWISFALCIVATVMSFLLSVKAHRQQLRYIDEYYLEGREDALDKHKTSGFVKALQGCTWAAIILFIAGLFCTILFACENVARFRMNDNKVKGTPVKIDELHSGREPMDMTPVVPVKPAPANPVPAKPYPPTSGIPQPLEKGRQPVGMTPVKPTQPQPTPAPPQKPSGS